MRPLRRHLGQSYSFTVKDGELFWKAAKIETTVRLRVYEMVLATAVALSTVVSALWPIATHFGWIN